MNGSAILTGACFRCDENPRTRAARRKLRSVSRAPSVRSRTFESDPGADARLDKPSSTSVAGLRALLELRAEEFRFLTVGQAGACLEHCPNDADLRRVPTQVSA